jgi:hypothetical protein
MRFHSKVSRPTIERFMLRMCKTKSTTRAGSQLIVLALDDSECRHLAFVMQRMCVDAYLLLRQSSIDTFYQLMPVDQLICVVFCKQSIFNTLVIDANAANIAMDYTVLLPDCMRVASSIPQNRLRRYSVLPGLLLKGKK